MISFTSLDYASSYEDITSHLAQDYAARGETLDLNPGALPRLVAIVGAYITDLASYHMNGLGREFFASTLQRRQNLIRLEKPFGVAPEPASSAIVTLRLTLDSAAGYPFKVSTRDQFSTEADLPTYFHPVTDTQVNAYGPGYVDIEAVEGELYEGVNVLISQGTAAQKAALTLRDVVVESIRITVANVVWGRVSTFVNSSSTSKHYRVVYDDLGNVLIYFGDGVNGLIPPNGALVSGTFRVGGGRRGRVGADSVTAIVTANEAVTGVNNAAPSTEGENAQPLRTARYGLANVLNTMLRAVEESGYERLAFLAAPGGIAKTRSRHIGGGFVTLAIAPNGGGQPSVTLKNNVLSYFEGKKGIGQRLGVTGSTYRDVRLSVLLYVNDAYKSDEVRTAVSSGLLAPDETGILDFNQLDYAAARKSVDGEEELLLSSTRLQSYFGSLYTKGLARAEILRLDVEPTASPGTTNTGNGAIAVAVPDGSNRRRTYRVTMTTPTSYDVAELASGLVTSLTDHRVYDLSTDFAAVGVTTAWRLQPDEGNNVSFPITTVGDGYLEVPPNTGTFFALSAPKRTYNVLAPTSYSGTAGVPLSLGGYATLTFTAGSIPHVGGDTFVVDVYPQVSDLRLRAEEYPRVTSANLTLRTVGGTRRLPMRSTFISVQGYAAGVPYLNDSMAGFPVSFTLSDALGDTPDLVSRTWQIFGVSDFGAQADPTLSSATATLTTLSVTTVITGASAMWLVKCIRLLANGTSTYDVGVVARADSGGNYVPAPGAQPWMFDAVQSPGRGWAGGYSFAALKGAALLNEALGSASTHGVDRRSVRSGSPLVCEEADLVKRLVGAVHMRADPRASVGRIDSIISRITFLLNYSNCAVVLSVENSVGTLINTDQTPTLGAGGGATTFVLELPSNGLVDQLFFVYASLTAKTTPCVAVIYNTEVAVFETGMLT